MTSMMMPCPCPSSTKQIRRECILYLKCKWLNFWTYKPTSWKVWPQCCLLTVIKNYMINYYALHYLKRQFVYHFIFPDVISNFYWGMNRLEIPFLFRLISNQANIFQYFVLVFHIFFYYFTSIFPIKYWDCLKRVCYTLKNEVLL